MRGTAVSVAGSTLLGLALVAGLAHGADEAPTGRETPATSAGSRLDLSIRARSLGLVPEPFTAPSIGFEAQKVPTGPGTLRMPSARAEIAPGLYLEVLPSCLPGVDDVRVPLRRRGQLPRR